MTQEEKELLLKDLCARLPYGVKVEYFDLRVGDFCIDVLGAVYPLDERVFIGQLPLLSDTSDFDEISLYNNLADVENIKPYLFPISSMTEEQIFLSPFSYATMDTIRKNESWSIIEIDRNDYYKLTDWFNKNHFDYRGLIEKSLALDATNLGIYR